MRCGFVPPQQRVEPPPQRVLYVPGTDIREPEMCPGYLVQLPAVSETARAWGHWDKGQLWQRYKDPPEMLVILVELFNQARAGAETYYMDERSNKR